MTYLQNRNRLTDIENKLMGDSPGGPLVKNPPYNAGDAGLIPVRELRFHMPQSN